MLDLAKTRGRFVRDRGEWLVAAMLVHVFWNPMLEKRIPRQVAEDAVVYLYTIARIAALSVVQPETNALVQHLLAGKGVNGKTGFTEHLFTILFNRRASPVELVELKYLMGLTLTNGPGTLSAKGAKESVSARNAIPTAFVGFLSNTGLAHGGNGFEAVEFLLEHFEHTRLQDPGSKESNIDLLKLANEVAKSYARYKTGQKEAGRAEYKRIPCINHPVFKGKDVNIDPREDFVKNELERGGIANVFLDFYHHLVRELFNEGVTENVFCVNIDAVLAVIALKLIWNDLKKGKMDKKEAQDLVFSLFLLGRSIGTAAEIADHRARGQDMDCRTPQKELAYVL
jgi:citrate synthase